MIELINSFLGPVPDGFETMPYLLSGVILIYLLVLIFNTLIHFLGGK